MVNTIAPIVYSLSSEQIIALGGLLTIISSGISSWIVRRSAVRKDEVERLREEVIRLQKRVDAFTLSDDAWRTNYDKLYNHDLLQRRLLIDNGIAPPDMPILERRKADEATTKASIRPLLKKIRKP